jgi:alkanesulfonate monooxygenase
MAGRNHKQAFRYQQIDCRDPRKIAAGTMMETSAMHVEFTSRAERWTIPQAQSPEFQIRQMEVRAQARAAERAGFERLLIADPLGLPDNSQLASFVLHSTSSLGVVASHDAGTVAPTVAAQQFAMLDQLSGGRLSIRIVVTQGDLDHEAAHARADEYLVLMKRLWANDNPFDHEGPFYSVRGGHSAAKPFGRMQIPLMLGGVSGTAVKLAARHADVFALPAASVAETRQLISRVQAAAAHHGRADRIGYSAPVQLVVASTREEAQTRADQLPAGTGALRLVGTPEQVARALKDYCALGVKEFVLHDLAHEQDLDIFVREVAPRVRGAREAAGDFRARSVFLCSPRTRVRYYA